MKIQILKVGMWARQIAADDGMISRMVAAYNPKYHEAPLFIGEGVDTTTPAVGWVTSLTKAGDALYAEIGQIHSQVEKDLNEGRRRVRKVGFYSRDYGLRHVSLTGEPIFIPGIPTRFKEKRQYYEFQQGGNDMGLMDDPRMKAFLRLGDEINCGLQTKQFSEGDNPGEILHRKTMDILLHPPLFDESGQRIRDSINYSVAFNMACAQNPDLAARYIQQIEDVKYRNMKPFNLL